jgi:hypothetical protein
VMYPELDAWREVRARLDPHGRWRSDLGRRLGLCPPSPHEQPSPGADTGEAIGQQR